ncbi:c-type cytochrome [Sulfitobacter aestuariivivens]|uniref:c-type cytochrome n=1 Tax=Sulfitobacter aestuariivivens TaxID=2766981 RepID=UPI003623E3B6
MAAARVLIEHGADVNFRNSKDRPPIHNAAAAGRQEFVDFLRANGAGPRTPEPITDTEFENADIEAGRRVMFGCNTCHEIAADKPATGTHVGPSLIGVFGAPSANRDDFQYSAALERLGVVWTVETLNSFLADPTGVAPGTEMLWAPDMSRQERIGVIALLRSAEK